MNAESYELNWPDSGAFFFDAAEWGEHCILSGEDAHHLSRVLRLQRGDDVRLMDGFGREGVFCIEKIFKNSVELRCLKEIVHPKPKSGVIIAAAWTKAARRSWIFEKAVEFGAAGIWFWQAEHSQFPVPEEAKDQWRAQMIAGMKQCRNPWLPEIMTFPRGAESVIHAALEIPHKHILLENTFGNSPMLKQSALAGDGITLCVIGPEGGFTPQEVDLFNGGGFKAFSLGKRVLRWETAAILCLGLHWWGSEIKADSSTFSEAD